jgi:2-(1,2-epoxy-1,2-dihydrophenyl)acetyl-CoA isomerase
MTDSRYSCLIVDYRDNICRITLNRPESLNSLTPELLAELRDCLDDLARDVEVRCVLLVGAGGSFSSGGDLLTASRRRNATENGASIGPLINDQLSQLMLDGQSIEKLLLLPKPCVAALDGWAVGGGLMLALACDFRIGARSAVMRLGYLRRALSGDFGVSTILPALVGAAKARQLLMLDDDLTADDALACGLLTSIVDDLERASWDLCRRLATGPTFAFGKMKENLLFAASGDLSRVLHREAVNTRLAALTDDALEGVAALRENRPPSFTGH